MAELGRAPRRDLFDFSYDVAAQAIGAVIAVAVVAISAIAFGFIQRSPETLIPAVGGLAVGASVAAVLFYGRARWFRREARQVERRESNLLHESLRESPYVYDDATDDEIRNALDRLPDQERTVVVLRFGVPKTSAEIGDGLGVSSAKIRALERQGLEKLHILLAAGRGHTEEGAVFRVP